MKPLPRFKWDIDSTSHWRRWINIPRSPPPHPLKFQQLAEDARCDKTRGHLNVTKSTLPINFQKTAFGCPGFSFPAILLKLHNYCVQPEKHTPEVWVLRHQDQWSLTLQKRWPPKWWGCREQLAEIQPLLWNWKQKKYSETCISGPHMKLTGLVAQCVSNASFHILKKERSRGWEIVVFIRINPKNAKIPILPNITIKI